jgi:hypothetical protein
MKALTLMRHYDRLKPLERLALLVAAEARDDEVEQQHLCATGPQGRWSCYSHQFALLSLHVLTSAYVTEQLDALAEYWHGLLQAWIAREDEQVEISLHESLGQLMEFLVGRDSKGAVRCRGHGQFALEKVSAWSVGRVTPIPRRRAKLKDFLLEAIRADPIVRVRARPRALVAVARWPPERWVERVPSGWDHGHAR